MNGANGSSGAKQGPRSHVSRRMPRIARLLPRPAGLGLMLVFGAVSPRASPPATDSHPATLRERSVTVVFSARIIPRGEAALGSPRMILRLPVDLPHQTLDRLEVEGTPKRAMDRWNSPVLVYERSELKPGEILTGRWTVSAVVREFQWMRSPSPNDGVVSLPADERALYLRDGAAFDLSHPAVREAAKQACAGRSNDWSRLEGIFDLVMERLQYERDGKWQPAPEALTSGKGSCSEFSYAFIALCRASGIPARYVGGLVGRTGVPLHVDTVFHRYPQAFVSGVGWVDFDPTRTDRAKDRRLYFGRTSPGMLLLCVGDGGEGSATGWDYLESHRWSGGASKAVRLRTGWWFPEPPSEVRKAVADFRARLSAPRSDPRALVAHAAQIGHPFVLPWLDDLLYEPAARVSVADVFLKIGGQASLRAVVNSLRRVRDRDGDRRIGELLNSFTGQKWGDDREKWREWLNTRRAPPPTSSPLPRGDAGRTG